ncbi:RMD11 [Arthroderma uncinatum]|uniref:RMD11 n=1 Tax=Arthroderma uncinatum TaxID=74035 RepID=UPI00144A511A|nr:RMD11 [Arthroderma uncinatum]KAF3481482.1 RMD11 [Arthroderma uncinatum]
MSSVIRPPDPCLIAIALVVRSRAGPRFVYHYPPNPSITESPSTSPNKYDSLSREDQDQETKATDSGASVDEEGLTSEDEDDASVLGDRDRDRDRDRERGVGAADKDRRSPSRSHVVKKKVAIQGAPDGDGSESIREEKKADLENVLLQGDSFLGLKCDIWEKLLSPSPAWHKRRFEVGVNDLTFVGWPVFVRKDGTWRKRKKKKKKKGKEKRNEEKKTNGENGSSSGIGSGISAGELSVNVPVVSIPDTDDDDEGDTTAANDESDDQSEEELSMTKDGMTMFNVVFVLNPPTLEYNVRIREMYDNVIKKFGKALKSEQARANYVWKEAQSILRIKEKCREERCSVSAVYSQLFAKSSLAQAIETLYTNIAASKIASVSLGPQTSMSMQILPMTSTPHLPSPNEPGYPGLWLTTADSISATDEASVMATSGQSQVLAKHFALLLLNDENTILKDIEASKSTIGPPLAHYIRSSKPTKSFAQISARSRIPLSDIQVLASHLVYWRRARAIPPLNKKDTYIVSPNADMSKLAIATTAYESMFPTLPSLPKMLAALSGSPRPYFSYIPSRDHKEAYYEILAWLVRGGWVTQLRTFGWVKVSPEVKSAVREAMMREERRKSMSMDKRRPSFSAVRAMAAVEENYNGEGDKEKDGDGDEDEDEDGYGSSSSSSLDSEMSGDATPVPGRLRALRAGRTTSSLILRPHRASPVESRWLDYILTRFPDPSAPMAASTSTVDEGRQSFDTDESELDMYVALRKYWPVFTKYFNGTDALQKIAVREGLPHRLVWRVLGMVDVNTPAEGEGAWDEREKVLVTVRHW